jgi:uncharacterized protein YnzC (UPF0291/DUF896 family)
MINILSKRTKSTNVSEEMNEDKKSTIKEYLWYLA